MFRPAPFRPNMLVQPRQRPGTFHHQLRRYAGGGEVFELAEMLPLAIHALSEGWEKGGHRSKSDECDDDDSSDECQDDEDRRRGGRVRRAMAMEGAAPQQRMDRVRR